MHIHLPSPITPHSSSLTSVVMTVVAVLSLPVYRLLAVRCSSCKRPSLEHSAMQYRIVYPEHSGVY